MAQSSTGRWSITRGIARLPCRTRPITLLLKETESTALWSKQHPRVLLESALPPKGRYTVTLAARDSGGSPAAREIPLP
jgi:hypothetical protein